ncbi:hypothetical protein BU251_07960 [Candidatus Velamenicoccus archaeovorus]|uniref:Divergent PAP2 family protein n=1 Tax=Velamenicoccus archaeovorus TaxID=1930593 RepID=A0A410P632_VELA1|nr:divergent PAP2 family protein [Candidatus Velamenicoccus archaeovorus]QAT17656.1 hypothetical protein BU251_07960 [Candidatus Velamenicoccus archaeovorus]
MKLVIYEIVHNHVLIVTFLAWLTAQTIKVALGVLRTKRFDFRWFIGTGGMPSAHSAGSSALAVVIGTDYGFDSPLFALGVVFAIVTMFDAQGVRRSTGKQASILNKILDDIYWQGKIEEDRLKELIGHTPIEVIMGAIIGILLGLIY